MKLLNIFLIVLFALTLTSCVETNIDDDEDKDKVEMGNIINIYTINDFHGAIFENVSSKEIGISKIGEFLKNEKTENPLNTVILSAGDMFQGTAVSSLTRGRIVVDLMNYIGFDAMTVGNHEFDWGVSEITRYVDGDQDNGEAEFPFLGANIYNLPSENYVDWAKPYTVITKGDIKIGILGLIGEDLTSSIIGSISKDFEFTSQLDAIKKYVPILRNEEDADIVIVVSHDNTQDISYQIKNLKDEYYVDAVVNGHTHSYYAFAEQRDNLPDLVGVQSGNNGKFIGELKLELDLENKKVIKASAGFVSQSKLSNTSTGVEAIISEYQEYVDISNEFLGYAGEYLSQADGVTWAANTIADFENSDFGIVNSGGIRSAGFPILGGDSVTYGTIFKIMPFENTVITVNLTGAQLKNLASRPGDIKFSSNFNASSLVNNETYKVSVVDYVFYRDEFIFMQGTEINYHTELFRDLLVEQVKQSVAQNGKWYI